MEEERKQTKVNKIKVMTNEESVNEELTDQGKERLENKLNEAYSKQDDLHNKYLRVHADLENLKKRAIKEREDVVHRTRSQIMTDLLPFIDSFKMGLLEASKNEQVKTFVDGFEMAMNQLENTLSEYGLIRLESDMIEFDPKIHEAISYEENDEVKEGIVIKTIREGYKLGDKLIRPATVILSKGQREEA